MKNAIFYSPDLNLCVSLLLYFQDRYKVTTTTDLDILQVIAVKPGCDLIIIDAEPDLNIEHLCRIIRQRNEKATLILTYVYKSSLQDMEKNIRLTTDAVFYKPVDLVEVTKKLNQIVNSKNEQPK